MKNRQTARQWSEFWEHGSLTSFIGRFKDNYEGEILAFWYLEFRKLPNRARIVDLATGNGALALMAAQYSEANNKDFDVTAIDYADIRPEAHIKEESLGKFIPSITFLGNTAIEETGLEPGSFDCAISQFGFEYGDPRGAVKEAGRILKPTGAKFIAMMHDENSAIIRQAKDGLGQVVVCEESGLHAVIAELLKRLDVLKADKIEPVSDAEAEGLREKLNDMTGKLHESQTQFRDPSMLPFYLKNSMAVFNSSLTGSKGLDEKMQMLAQVEQELQNYRQRMEDLVSAANSEASFRELEDLLAREGFQIQRSEDFFFEGVHFCHCLIASR